MFERLIKRVVKITAYHCRQCAVADEPIEVEHITKRVMETLNAKDVERDIEDGISDVESNQKKLKRQ